MASSTEEGWDEGDSSDFTTSNGTGVTETTGLLRAGASADASAEGTWAGDADFVGLPWWKRPSVC